MAPNTNKKVVIDLWADELPPSTGDQEASNVAPPNRQQSRTRTTNSSSRSGHPSSQPQTRPETAVDVVRSIQNAPPRPARSQAPTITMAQSPPGNQTSIIRPPTWAEMHPRQAHKRRYPTPGYEHFRFHKGNIPREALSPPPKRRRPNGQPQIPVPRTRASTPVRVRPRPQHVARDRSCCVKIRKTYSCGDAVTQVVRSCGRGLKDSRTTFEQVEGPCPACRTVYTELQQESSEKDRENATLEKKPEPEPVANKYKRPQTRSMAFPRRRAVAQRPLPTIPEVMEDGGPVVNHPPAGPAKPAWTTPLVHRPSPAPPSMSTVAAEGQLHSRDRREGETSASPNPGRYERLLQETIDKQRRKRS
ncbi:MAG: hypothetical protein M1828_003212 [Chrysothrix sp. TS-e1954]|nr:MAG: hypothetical protein M1828_003212 [Chrysothrix sp. TS-e1954]